MMLTTEHIMHGHPHSSVGVGMGQSALFGCSTAGHSGINQLGESMLTVDLYRILHDKNRRIGSLRRSAMWYFPNTSSFKRMC